MNHEPKYELRLTVQMTDDGEIPGKLFGTFKTEAKALAEGRRLGLDPDMHYITREVVVYSEPGYHPVWGTDDDYGFQGVKYLNEFTN